MEARASGKSSTFEKRRTLMAYNLPTIPGDKIDHFRRRLVREVSNMFAWKGLEELNIPVDRMEYNLITMGRLMFFPEPDYAYLILPANATGFNLYNEPTRSRVIAPDNSKTFDFGERTIIYGYTPKPFETASSCVLLDNMLFGESLHTIIEFYARRLALVWQSLDTNLLWQNLPPIISVQNESVRLSIEKLLEDIFAGKPLVVKDDMLKLGNDSVQVGLVDVPIIAKELLDTYQEIYNDFKQMVGIKASAVDKQSGVTETESTSNDQHIRTALDVMLSQRKKFCKVVNKVYGLSIEVDVMKEEKEEDDDGESDDRAGELSEDSDI
jgi:hypothetical protein